MSYDLSTRTAPCDHSISLERYVVDTRDFVTLHWADDTTLNMRAPINGREQVKLSISGTLVYPNHPWLGYTIAKDTNRINTEDAFSKIVFRFPQRFIIPLIEVSYITQTPYCLKCNGSSKVNDLKPAVSGSLKKITDTDKLTQRALKFILTSKCAFYPTFTCLLKTYLAHKFGVQVTEQDVSNEVSNALQNMQQIQQAQRTVQPLTPLESIQDIVGVSAEIDANDPRLLHVSTIVRSFGNITTPLTLNFRINQ